MYITIYILYRFMSLMPPGICIVILYLLVLTITTITITVTITTAITITIITIITIYIYIFIFIVVSIVMERSAPPWPPGTEKRYLDRNSNYTINITY